MERKHFLHFDIAGFTYWDGPLVFNELKIGGELQLKIEADNKFDQYAVALWFGDHKIGFIPRSDNHTIYKFLEQGYSDIFETRINRVTPDAMPEDQVGVIVYLKNRFEENE